MANRIITSFGLLALLMAGVSCVNNLEEGPAPLPENGTRVSLTVTDGEWNGERSSYIPGEGISLTKAEKIALLYDDGSLLVGNASYSLVASPEGAGSYNFTAPAGSLDKTWYGIVPYSYDLTRARINTNQRMMITFPSIQFPGQNTFDPATDFLVARPFNITGDAGSKTAAITSFKRLTAPFKLRITGLGDSEKIYATTIALSRKANGTAALTMAGRCFYTIGASPDDFAFESVQLAYTRSNSISAVYDDGLSKEGGCWPVWFNVRPITIPSSTNVTVTVFTADACYTRTVPIGAGTFATDRINTFTVNIKGSGYTSEPAISQAFFGNGLTDATLITSTATQNTIQLTATDGVQRDWEVKGYNWSAAKMDGGSMLPNAIGFPKGQDSYVKIPSVENNTITKVRLYLHPLSHVENYAFPITVYNGESSVATVTSVSMLDAGNGYTAGGIIDIPCPGGLEDMTGLKLQFGACTRNAAALVSRIVLFTHEETPPPPEPPLPSISDDYYQDFVDGDDVVIGGTTYNKSSHPSYALVRLSQLGSGSELAVYLDGTYNIVFLDYLAEDAGLDRLTVNDADIAPAAGVAVVGRYPEHHGEIIFEGKRFVPQGSFALRNVCVRSNTWVFYTSGFSSSANRFDIEDCEIFTSPASGVQGGLVSDNAASAVLGSMTMRNSVVVRLNDYNHSMFYFRSGLSGDVPYTDYVIENNAFIYESDIIGRETCTSSLFMLSSDSDIKNPSLNFTFRNNSVLGYRGNGTVLACCNPSSIVFEGNALDFKLTSVVYMFNIYYPYAQLSSLTSYTGGNYCNNSGAFVSGVDIVSGETLMGRFGSSSPNRFTYGLSPFSLVDASIGYLRPNPSTAGSAGCSYTTKLWRAWDGDSGGNTESYGSGYGSGSFGWN